MTQTVASLEAQVQALEAEVRELRGKLGMPAQKSPLSREVDVQPAKKWKKEGKWVGNYSGGGCFNHESWYQNPQFFLQVKKDTKVMITVSPLQQGGSPLPFGFYVLKSDGIGRKIVTAEGSTLVVAKSPFGSAPAIDLQCTLEANVQPYIILPTLFEPIYQGAYPFTIEVTSEEDVIVEGEDADGRGWKVGELVASEWTKATSGGCRNHKTFYDNPQFLFELKSPTAVLVELKVPVRKDMDTLGLYVVRLDGSKDERKLADMEGHQETVMRSKFVSSERASCTGLLGIGKYVIIPCTFDPGFPSKFTLQYATGVDGAKILKGLSSSPSLHFSGKWDAGSAGGSLREPSWRINPKYVLDVKETSDVTISVRPSAAAAQTVGFYIFHSEQGKLPFQINAQNRVYRSAFFETLSLARTIKLEKRKEPYILVLAMFDANLQAGYDLSISGDHVSARPYDDSIHVKHEGGQWKRGESAGGCMNHSTWVKNPRYEYKAVEGGKMAIVLRSALSDGSLPTAGFYVFRTAATQAGQMELSLDKTSTYKGKFLKDGATQVVVEAKAGDRYQIVPCTFDSGLEGSFTLDVYTADAQAELRPFICKAISIEGEWKGVSAGGSTDHNTFMNNPHFGLELKRPMSVMAVLEILGDTSKVLHQSIGMYLCKGDGSGFPDISSEEDVLDHSPFMKTQHTEVGAMLPLYNPMYVITPCTKDKGVPEKFRISLYAEEIEKVKFYATMSGGLAAVDPMLELEKAMREKIVAEAQKGFDAINSKLKAREMELEAERQKLEQRAKELDVHKKKLQDHADALSRREFVSAARPTIDLKKYPSVVAQVLQRVRDEVSVPVLGYVEPKLIQELSRLDVEWTSKLKKLEQEHKAKVKDAEEKVKVVVKEVPVVVAPKEEVPVVVTPKEEVIEVVVPPPPPCNVTIPAPPTLVSVSMEEEVKSVSLKPVEPTRKRASSNSSSVDMLLASIRQGKQLKSGSTRVLKPKPAAQLSIPINLAKIKARRKAMETIEEEEEENDEEWL